MIILFIVFAIFAVALPVALEERHHPGDNILRRAGLNILESRLAQRLGLAYNSATAKTGAVYAGIVSLLAWVIIVTGTTAAVLGILSKFLSKLINR